jgi:hypothetical protein
MAENDTEGQEEGSSLSIVQGHVAGLAKDLAFYTGTIYVIGFLVTGARLAAYGVASVELVNTQYLVAGLMPGLFLWITVLVVVSASRYEPRTEDGGWKTRWIWANVLFSMAVGILLVLPAILGERFDAAWDGLYPEAVPLVLLLGELALWILIVGFRQRQLRRWLLPSREMERNLGTIARWAYGGYLVLSALLLIVFAPGSALDFYEELPQAYGGGKLLTVRLYVDGENVPTELLEPGHDPDQDALAWTIPLNLVFKTSEEFILVPLGDDEPQTWILKASEVHTIASE